MAVSTSPYKMQSMYFCTECRSYRQTYAVCLTVRRFMGPGAGKSDDVRGASEVHTPPCKPRRICILCVSHREGRVCVYHVDTISTNMLIDRSDTANSVQALRENRYD